MGLKDLIRQPEHIKPSSEANDEAAQAFISGAPVSATPAPKRKRKKAQTFVRTTFSLSKDVNKKIDKIVLLPRNMRISRSDVIRAGIMALQNLDKADLLTLLEAASKAEPMTDSELDE
jgi:Arc/MetJ-type ribon-helix-helix transcriptional regulator